MNLGRHIFNIDDSFPVPLFPVFLLSLLSSPSVMLPVYGISSIPYESLFSFDYLHFVSRRLLSASSTRHPSRHAQPRCGLCIQNPREKRSCTYGRAPRHRGHSSYASGPPLQRRHQNSHDDCARLHNVDPHHKQRTHLLLTACTALALSSTLYRFPHHCC